METNLAAEQPEQPTAAPVEAESAPAQVEETKPVEKADSDKEPEWFVKRIGEFTARFRGEERARQAAEQRAYQLEQQLAQVRQQPAQEEKPKTLADFEYDEGKYQNYLFDQAEKRAEAAARRVQVEQQQTTDRARRDRTFQERAIAFQKEDPKGWEAAVTAPLDDRVVDVIKDLENGPQIAAYLGTNPDLALPLNHLPERVLAIELGRIDAKLSREKADKQAALAAAKAAKAVTSAPPPAPQIEATNAQVEKDPSQMSDAEFAKWRKKQIEQRRYR